MGSLAPLAARLSLLCRDYGCRPSEALAELGWEPEQVNAELLNHVSDATAMIDLHNHLQSARDIKDSKHRRRLCWTTWRSIHIWDDYRAAKAATVMAMLPQLSAVLGLRHGHHSRSQFDDRRSFRRLVLEKEAEGLR